MMLAPIVSIVIFIHQADRTFVNSTCQSFVIYPNSNGIGLIFIQGDYQESYTPAAHCTHSLFWDNLHLFPGHRLLRSLHH
jgi:hypothetical protein